MSNAPQLSKKAKIRVDWHTLASDYSHKAQDEIIAKIKNKYGIPKENIKVNPSIYVKNKKGEIIEYENDITYNIQIPEFQHGLFKEYIEEKGIKDCDFNAILDIDKSINERIDYSLYEPNKHYFIKWIKWSNFMSYGSGNIFDFRDLHGLVLLSSDPANQGGKTTFCLDLIRFLLFGKVTSRENDWVLAKVFNKYIPEATEVVVEGCICIDGVDYVIKRVVSRPKADKRSDKSKVSQKVDYYKLVNDEYVGLVDDECENERGTQETNKVIKETIGNESDFDLMICVDSDNLKSLISLRDTERGKLISRWIGLIVLQKKDEIARKKYNEEVSRGLTMSKYNKVELESSIGVLNEEILRMEADNDTYAKNEKACVDNIDKYMSERDTIVKEKRNIDESIVNVDVHTVESKLQRVIEDGKIKRQQLEENRKALSAIPEVRFSMDEYKSVKQEERQLNDEIVRDKVTVNTLTRDIELLKKGEFCPTCGVRLKNVNNTEKIKAKTDELNTINSNSVSKKERHEQLLKKIEELERNKESVDKKDRMELIVAKNEADRNTLLSQYNELKSTLKLIEDNKQTIEKNNEIDIKVNNLNVMIKNEQSVLDTNKKNIMYNKIQIELKKKTITEYEGYLKKIDEEEILLKHWKIYLDMIGKNGISKLVVRTVLPQINVELKQLLDDVCDFDVEVEIDSHNDVEFNLIHDGVKSNLSAGSGFEQTVSSLALRTVLSKISTFSKPSFVVFDEILGGVAADNYDNVKKLFEKIMKQYQCILFITHNNAHKEWADRTITVTKKDNISHLSLE